MKTKQLAVMSLFAALTAVGAFIRIPLSFYPVPFTLQTAFVFLAGLCMEPREAFFSQLAYVALGLVGLPVFSAGGGIQYIFNPTFGFLLAFPFISAGLSIASKRFVYIPKKKPVPFILLAAAILVAGELFGAAYMLAISRFYIGTDISIADTLNMVLLFLPLDALKLALACYLSRVLTRRLKWLRKSC